MGKLIEQELNKIVYADLSNYDESTNTYYIPKREDFKLNLNKSYVVKVKNSLFQNELLKTNYNNNSYPPFNCYVIDILMFLKKIIKVNAIEYDLENNRILNNRWIGYLSIKDIEVIKEL